MIDLSHPELETVRSRIANEEVIWLVTVRSDGQPQASPVWSVWDDNGLLVYSRPDTGKLKNIASNPRVCLHLDGGVEDHTTAILEGQARRSGDPPADQFPAFVEKYEAGIDRLGWTPEGFAADYSVSIRITLHKLRAW